MVHPAGSGLDWRRDLDLQDRGQHVVFTYTSSPLLSATAMTSSSASSMASPSATPTQKSDSGNGGPTSSPLLFFVALGFGVVFTNLW